MIIYHGLIVHVLVRTRGEEPRRPGKHLEQGVGTGTCLIQPCCSGAIPGFKHELGSFSSCLRLSGEGEQESECALRARAVGAHGACGACIPLGPPATCPPRAGSRQPRAASGDSSPRVTANGKALLAARLSCSGPNALTTSSAKSILSPKVLPALGLGIHVRYLNKWYNRDETHSSSG